MSMRVLRSAAVVAALGVALTALVVPSAGAAAPTMSTSPPMSPSLPVSASREYRGDLGSHAHQRFSWQWSDLAALDTRTFLQTTYGEPRNLPRLMVTVEPAAPSRLVYLEFFQDGRWVAEDIMRTDASGMAVVSVDPFCRNETWCDGTYRYRLRIASQSAQLSISYFEH